MMADDPEMRETDHGSAKAKNIETKAKSAAGPPRSHTEELFKMHALRKPEVATRCL